MSLAYFLAADNPPADTIRHLYQKKQEGGWQLDVSGLPLPADLPAELPADMPADMPAEDPGNTTPPPAGDAPAAANTDRSTPSSASPSGDLVGQGAGTPLPHSAAAGPAVLARHDSRAINGALIQLARGEAVLAG